MNATGRFVLFGEDVLGGLGEGFLGVFGETICGLSGLQSLSVFADCPIMDYTAPGFDPALLRVIDLRKILTDNHVLWASKHRKSDLINIFNTQLIPKLQKEKDLRELEEKKLQERREKDVKLENQNKKTHQPSVEQIQPHVVAKKRKFNDIRSFEDVTYNDQLKRKIKKRKHVSPEHKLTMKKLRESAQPTPVSSSKSTLFDRNNEIKFDVDEANVNDKPENVVEKFGDINVDKNINNIDNDFQNRHIPPQTPSFNPKLDTIFKLEPNYDNKRPPIANSTFTEIKLPNDTTTEINDDDPTNNSILTTKDDSVSSTLNEIKIKNEPGSKQLALNGPLNNINSKRIISKQLIENDIKVKIEKLNQLRNEIDNDLKLIANNESLNSDDIEISESPFPNNNSISNLTSNTYNDSELLTQLQHEFEIENSKIEIESDKVLNLINSKEKFKYYKFQYIKLMIGWSIIILSSFIFVLYRHERISIGFCGYENRGNSLLSLFHIKLPCVKCPSHAICYPNSQILCLNDYIMSKPLFWSIFGILPTFNKCILDSTKIKKINKIVKNVVNLLSERNANIKCGNGTDNEVALNFKQITEITDSKLLIDLNDPSYKYYWNKVKLILTTRTDLKFLNNADDENPLIRSTSLSKLSLNCRLKKIIKTIIIKYKFYFGSIFIILCGLSYIFFQINQLQKRNEYYRSILKEVMNKLQKQSVEFDKKPYIAKIQLRDYYLPQLQKLTKHNRAVVWKSVVSAVEANSNIKVDDIEVNGDIMRVWTWSSDL